MLNYTLFFTPQSAPKCFYGWAVPRPAGWRNGYRTICR